MDCVSVMAGAGSRTRIKFCGITSAQDALAAVDAGADALGFVFYASSPRAVTIGQVKEILHSIPPFVARVGLFLNPEAEAVRAVLDTLRLDILQFHGAESPDFCASFGTPYMKALGASPDADLEEQTRGYPHAAAFLFDSHRCGEAGGTGKTFDWNMLPTSLMRPLVLAGGLTPGNVAEAVRRVRPYAVDVSSGVESAPGRKDSELMKSFVAEVKRADDS